MFQLCSTFLSYQKIIFSILTLTNLVLAEERPRSALEWITVSDAEKLPNGVCNEDLVHFGEWPCTINVREADEILEKFPFWERFEEQNKRRSRMFCRAIKDGCTYPGEALTWREKGIQYTYCTIMTKEKVYKNIDKHFQLLYNPKGAAQIDWLPVEGKLNVNFPPEVVKSDESQSCNFMLARYNDDNELGFVDSQGYVYYIRSESAKVFNTGTGIGNYSNYEFKMERDKDDYDLLIERPAIAIEVLEIEYGVPIRRTGEIQDQNSISETYLTNQDYNKEKSMSTTLSTTYTSSKSWSHSVQVGVSASAQIDFSFGPSAYLGKGSVTFGFETSFSSTTGWGGGVSTSRTVTHGADENVPPRSRIKVKMVIMQTIEDVPYTSKYKIKYTDGRTKTINDEGVMKNAFYASSNVISSAPESID